VTIARRVRRACSSRTGDAYRFGGWLAGSGGWIVVSGGLVASGGGLILTRPEP